MRTFWTEFKGIIKWAVRVAIAGAVVFLIGAAVAALYKDAAPDMYVWFSQTIQNLF